MYTFKYTCRSKTQWQFDLYDLGVSIQIISNRSERTYACVRFLFGIDDMCVFSHISVCIRDICAYFDEDKRVNIKIRRCISECIFVYVYIYIYVYTYVYIYTVVYIHRCIYTYICVYILT